MSSKGESVREMLRKARRAHDSALKAKAPRVIIHCVRHATDQSDFSEEKKPGVINKKPRLTTEGEEDAFVVGFEALAPFVLCSPTMHCIHTALVAYQEFLCCKSNPEGVKIVVLPSLRESGPYAFKATDDSCVEIFHFTYLKRDIIMKLQMSEEYADAIDISLCEDENGKIIGSWNGEVDPNENVKERARLVRQMLYRLGSKAMDVGGGGEPHWKHLNWTTRPNKNENVEIAVISHFNLLEALVGDSLAPAQPRSYAFAPHIDENYELVETEKSKQGWNVAAPAQSLEDVD